MKDLEIEAEERIKRFQKKLNNKLIGIGFVITGVGIGLAMSRETWLTWFFVLSLGAIGGAIFSNNNNQQ